MKKKYDILTFYFAKNLKSVFAFEIWWKWVLDDAIRLHNHNFLFNKQEKNFNKLQVAKLMTNITEVKFEENFSLLIRNEVNEP